MLLIVIAEGKPAEDNSIELPRSFPEFFGIAFHIHFKRQLMLLGGLASRPSSDVLRRSAFEEDSVRLRALNGKRGRGRPRATWARSVFEQAVAVAGNVESLSGLWMDTPAAKHAWRAAVRQHCT
ncbi:unnamed protein product [Polarella glacialis]|uniref:Uncharacterized protein n=1 Tax=Polarella glacialis TaxID=89957 RepID=A0A813HCB2_POLGL|nr:unnamed protein product [Polarella glacialis]